MKKAKEQLGVGTADITDKEIRNVNDVLKRKRLSYGYYQKTFENSFAALHDRKFALFVNSGTSALHLAVQALKEMDEWADGDEILVPALTFVATVNVILHNNLKPVFVDIDPTYFDIDCDQIEAAITKKTRAIMSVNVMGQSAQIDRILQIAKKHHLRVIEDSCETMLVSYQNKPVGSLSDISCFSTFVAHLIVTGVGGFATTNNDELAIRMRSLANHGRDGIYISIDDDKTTNKKKLYEIMERRFNFISVGHSFRATELEAAIGVAQLQRYKKIIKTHQKNALYLSKRLAPLREFLQLPTAREGAEHAFMTYPIIVKDKRVKRDELTFYLEQQNVETRFLLPLLSQPIYKKLFGEHFEDGFPQAKHVVENGFYVGCHQGFRKKELDYIADTFFAFFAKKKLFPKKKTT